MFGKGLVYCSLCLLFSLAVPTVWADCGQSYSDRVARILHQVSDVIKQGEAEKGLQLLESFVERYPEEQHFLPYSYLGSLYTQTADNSRALTAYRQALDLCQEDAGLWQNYARVAWDLKRYEIAASALDQAYQLNGDDELLFNVVLARIHNDEKTVAVELLGELLERKKGQAELNWVETYVSLCLDLKQSRAALSALKGWQPFYEQEVKFWQLLALLYLQQDNYTEAAASLKIAASFGELDSRHKRLLADLLFQLKTPLQAAKLYESLLAEQPRNLDLMEQLVSAYRLGLQPEKALQVVERSLAVEQTLSMLRYRGEIYFDRGEYQQAFDAFAELLDADPQCGAAYLYQGYSALQLDDRKKARSVLTRALQFEKEKKEANRLLTWLRKN